MPPRRTATALVIRVCDRDGNLLHFRIEGLGGPGNSRCSFVGPEHVPAFEGEQGWFEMERIYTTPWNYWKPVKWLGAERPGISRAG
jgi:hypothetical protein